MGNATESLSISSVNNKKKKGRRLGATGRLSKKINELIENVLRKKDCSTLAEIIEKCLDLRGVCNKKVFIYPTYPT